MQRVACPTPGPPLGVPFLVRFEKFNKKACKYRSATWYIRIILLYSLQVLACIFVLLLSVYFCRVGNSVGGVKRGKYEKKT